MKAKFAVWVIVLGMSGPMLAHGVQVDFTIRGDYFAEATDGGGNVESFVANDTEWVLSICYAPNISFPGFFEGGSSFDDASRQYLEVIQNHTVSNPFGFRTPTFIALDFEDVPLALFENRIAIFEAFVAPVEGRDTWLAGSRGSNFTGLTEEEFSLLIGSPFPKAFPSSVGDGIVAGRVFVRMDSMENPIDVPLFCFGVLDCTSGGLLRDALVPPWSPLDFATESSASGRWAGNIGDQFVQAQWEGEVIDVKVTIKGVPEPATLTLLGIGLLAGAAFRKRFK